VRHGAPLALDPDMRTLLLLVAVAGCTTPARVPPRPMGVQAHLAEAARHDADALALEDRALVRERMASPPPTRFVCGDQALADQVTSGGERLGVRAPCWSGELGAIERYRASAARLRADARQHRARARALVVAARTWCASLPPDELDHSPFDHREDLAAVSAELDGDRIRGARIRFRPVPNLTADWLRQTLACHQAISAAEGYDPMHLTSCPVVVPGAETSVIEDEAGLVVVVRAEDPAAALVIYARAEALLDDHLDDGDGAGAR
jgi:hypothetical protein